MTKSLKDGRFNMFTDIVIGQGNYAQICLGKNMKNQDLLAIKSINKNQIKDQNMKTNILQQIETLSLSTQYENPFILKYIDCFETKRNLYIITEQCQEGDATIYVKEAVNALDIKLKKQKFTENESLQIGFQIALALLTLGKSNTVHRDVTSENILFSRDIVKLGGFGCARVAPEGFVTSIGHPKNRGPEYYINELKTEKLDVWGLGCILYELFFGKHFLDGIQEWKFAENLSNKIEIPKNVNLNPTTIDQLQRIFEINYQNRIDVLSLIHHEAFDFCRNRYTALIHPSLQVECKPDRNKVSADKILSSLKGSLKSLKKDAYKFCIDYTLGEGACGIVYLGEVTATNEKIAVKAVPMSKIKKYNIEESINREVSNLSEALKQKNPFVIKFIDNFYTANNYYIITEFCDNGGLDSYARKRYETGNHITVKEAKEIVYQIILGLSSLTLNDIIHRDIKAENVFISGDTFKIGDFGSSRIVPGKFSTMAVGTRCNMAPEFFDCTAEKTAKVDIWAQGCLFHKLLFGKLFFDGKDMIQIETAIIKEKYECGQNTIGISLIEIIVFRWRAC